MHFTIGGGKDSRYQDQMDRDQERKEDLHQLETLPNNVDPARHRVNPQILSHDAFTLNSLCYGMRVPTGATSTWDRRVTPETAAFHARVLAEPQTKHASPTRGALGRGDGEEGSTRDNEEVGRARYDGRGQTSVNNYLLGEFAGTGEGQRQVKLGRQRGRDVEEPAHHFDNHTPTVRDRLHGGLNIVAGKIRMDQDISTRARAEFRGQTIDGH